jgi:hypothetical protein
LLALFNLFRKIFFIHIGNPLAFLTALQNHNAFIHHADAIASGCKAKPEICSGKYGIGRRSAISGIALQRKVEGGQRGKARHARFNSAMISKPSIRFSDCWRHRFYYSLDERSRKAILHSQTERFKGPREGV